MNDLLWRGAMEYIASCHQYVHTGLNQSWGRLVLYAAIHLYQCLRTALVYEFTQSLCLLNGVLYELLSTETGIDAHQQHHIDVADDIFQR